jgi:hypothetical protein
VLKRTTQLVLAATPIPAAAGIDERHERHFRFFIRLSF